MAFLVNVAITVFNCNIYFIQCTYWCGWVLIYCFRFILPILYSVFLLPYFCRKAPESGFLDILGKGLVSLLKWPCIFLNKWENQNGRCLLPFQLDFIFNWIFSWSLTFNLLEMSSLHFLMITKLPTLCYFKHNIK